MISFPPNGSFVAQRNGDTRRLLDPTTWLNPRDDQRPSSVNCLQMKRTRGAHNARHSKEMTGSRMTIGTLQVDEFMSIEQYSHVSLSLYHITVS